MSQKQLFSELSKNALHNICLADHQTATAINTEKLPTSSLKN